jgi:aminopeptidase N
MGQRHAALVVVLAIVCAVAWAPATVAGRRAPATPGAAGIGDPLFPRLGNGGYDVLHYDLRLRYETSAPAQAVDGMVRVVARATQALSRFDLDFAGSAVGDVAVNGRAATWRRDGEELVVTPPRPLRRGQVFSTRVRHFAAAPTPARPGQLTVAFFSTADGSATAPQPDLAHRVFPSNDHPRDKARFTFTLDVPAGTTAVANGVFAGRDARDGRWVWHYRQRQPMATELTQIVVGRFTITQRSGQDGVAVRDVTPTRLTAGLAPKLAVVSEQLAWLRQRVGGYPFDVYGTLVVDAPLGFALETQTLSLFDAGSFDAPRSGWAPVMVHELAHQWFGDSVSPWSWSDVWLNEGHATWYELLYAEEQRLLREATGFARVEALMRNLYGAGDTFRTLFGPVARPQGVSIPALFNPNVYFGGALALYALRQEIGAEAFAILERRWVQRFRGRSASTLDFIALASEVAGRDLAPFLRAWLYGAKTPPMPGHPDWAVTPASPAAAAAR